MTQSRTARMYTLLWNGTGTLARRFGLACQAAASPSADAKIRLALGAAIALLCATLAGGGTAVFAQQSQPNFQPLERGDLTEAEQKVLVIRGIEVGGDYALPIRRNQDKDLQYLNSSTTMDQDLRLRMQTVFNDDVAIRLTVQTATTSLDNSNLRKAPTNTGSEAIGQTLTLQAREAYLQYRFNPNSPINLGQYDLELGDMRGKVYRAVASGLGFDCRVGTWCMPFGGTKVGTGSADWLYHWGLTYRAYDEATDGFRRAFSVGIFRMIYTESNVPLGNNLGPATYDASTTTSPTVPTRVQMTDDSSANSGAGNPIYYDASYNYFGFRIHWEGRSFFSSFDVTSSQGSRTYHLFPDPTTGVVAPLGKQTIDGYATEVEMGWRWAPEKRGRLGARFMTASGDTNGNRVTSGGIYRSSSGNAYNRGLNGYYEITPGTYNGSRLYFNGVSSTVDLGGGLGHSVNNKQLWGLFLDYDDPDNARFGYSGGLYKIDLNDSILTTAGRPVKDVGVELDNMMIWYPHKRLAVQFELNLLSSGGAMSIDDNTPPPDTPQLFVQLLARILYRF